MKAIQVYFYGIGRIERHCCRCRRSTHRANADFCAEVCVRPERGRYWSLSLTGSLGLPAHSALPTSCSFWLLTRGMMSRNHHETDAMKYNWLRLIDNQRTLNSNGAAQRQQRGKGKNRVFVPQFKCASLQMEILLVRYLND